MDIRSLHILIVTYNAVSWLPLCCRREEDLPEGWRILVVDNASTDGTADVLARDYRHIRLIRGRENLGFGRANNLGLRHALDQGAEYVYLQNQDSAISIAGLAELARLSAKYPECGIISPVHCNHDGSALDYSFAAFCAAGALDCAVPGQRAPHGPELLFADWGIAAGWLLPRRTLLETGGFNPLFFHYGEDEDYINRLRFHGGKIGIAARVAMNHHRTPKAKGKAFSNHFLDRLMAMTDPNRPAASPARVLGSFAGPFLRQLLSGEGRKAAFLMRACRALLPGDAKGSIRDQVRRAGATFL